MLTAYARIKQQSRRCGENGVHTTEAGQETIDSIRLDELEALTPSQRDNLPFGVIGFAADGLVDIYNSTEQRLAGLKPDKVLGLHFFSSVAPCMNNFMVAQRFEDEPELDTIIDYVLTLRMRPTPVRLRLLKRGAVHRRYVLVERRTG